TFSKEIDYPKGEPENPLTWDEMIGKFNYVTSEVFDTLQQNQLVNEIRNIETIVKIDELSALLKGGILA
ncbi:MAG TPA: hypothetical protein VLK78_04760, partial [Candidatus Angelobacter sp.]|nr:hypothetical protein [Candidatus Angelobacter sp.]